MPANPRPHIIIPAVRDIIFLFVFDLILIIFSYTVKSLPCLKSFMIPDGLKKPSGDALCCR